MQSLLEELKQNKPFRDLHEEAFLSILVTAERLKTASAVVFKSSDLTHTQYNALRILRGAGDMGLTCGEISERMITRDSDITRMLDRLESRQLIRRERRDADRRIVRAFITAKGLELLAEIEEPLTGWQTAKLAGLDDPELRTLIALLEKVRNSIIGSD